MANLILFLGIYVSFGYFKKLNLESETLLKKQRNEAIEAQLKIEEQRKQLEELHAFQSHFWINLSHEIRTPLTLLHGASGKLKKLNPDPEIVKINHHFDRNIEKIKVLIDDVMDLSKLKANKLEMTLSEVDMVPFCRQTFLSFEPLFTEKNIRYFFSTQIEDISYLAKVDTLYMERVLGNLLTNAYKFTPEYGTIHCELSQEQNQFVISITDTGNGIADEDIPFIFDPFYKKESNNNPNGSGVGLAFVKEVIALHEGELSVQSEVGKGTRFRITLNISRAYPNIRTKTPPNSITHLQNDGKSPVILLAEDNDEMRAYLMDVLCDFTIVSAANGAEAIEMIELHPADIIITDYMMPVMNGFDFIEKIRNKGNDTPVIVLTARVDSDGKMNFLRLGIDDYLTKPFKEEELILRIQHCLKNNKERVSSTEYDALLPEDSPNNPELQEILHVIQANISSESFGVSELADQLAMTERTLHRKTKSMTGLTPNNLIREAKLRKVRSLYESKTVHSLKEMAIAIGMSNTSHLKKLYSERYGTVLRFSNSAYASI